MKAFVLHSGGLDSSVCLALAQRDFEEVISISVNYGQRHKTEVEYAKKLCQYYGVEHKEIAVPGVPKVMLTDASVDIPHMSYDELPYGISPTYVPFRNGLLLSNIAVLAQAEKADAIFFGAHAEDAQNWAYPDCTPEFIGAMANAIFIGTYQQVRLHTPLMWMRKVDIVVTGHELEVPFQLTWSCYEGGDKHCGKCPTCISRKQAFIASGVLDPTEYAVEAA